MASEDLLKKAVAAFNALSPEQQAEMLEEQRRSWVRGNVGLSRDERCMTSTVMPRPAPAATDTGLVTVEHQYWRDQTQEWLSTGFPDRYRKDGFQVRELVTRSQAVELLVAVTIERDFWKDRFQHDTEAIRKLEAELAAERAEKAGWKELHDAAQVAVKERTEACNNLYKQVNDLIADNAAKAARIKELEGINANLMGDDEDKPRYTTKRLKHEIARATEALEAKIAAAEKALEEADEALQADAIASAHAAIRAVLGGKPS